jgi:CRISPR-associated protein Csm4
MKLYEITLEPQGGLGTPLKGDTLFGHFCWQAAHDDQLLQGGLERQLASYPDKPCVVFSSAWPKLLGDQGQTSYAVRRPALPLFHLFPDPEGPCVQRLQERKQNKGKRWLLLPPDLKPDLAQQDNYLNDKRLLEMLQSQASPEKRRHLRKIDSDKFTVSATQPHNTINRLTGATGTGAFAPYTQEMTYYYPETHLAILVLVNPESTDIGRVALALERIGRFGYGKDASLGQGRFRILGHRELPLPVAGTANACFTLAPCIPEPGAYSETYFLPFVRFGKHGDRLARAAHPFKNPVVMADEGAVLLPRDQSVFDRPYLGRAATGISKAQPGAVAQGYAPYLPLNLEI